MFNAISHSRVFVGDQDEALDFYVGKLGLEVSADVDLEIMRWLTVTVPGSDHNILLEKAASSFRDEESAAAISDLMAKGEASMFILNTDDCQGTFDDLMAKGVEAVEEPKKRFYGTDCAVRDPFGNQIRITEPEGDLGGDVDGDQGRPRSDEDHRLAHGDRGPPIITGCPKPLASPRSPSLPWRSLSRRALSASATSSLPHGPGPLPGPELLYAKAPKPAPQLRNRARGRPSRSRCPGRPPTRRASSSTRTSSTTTTGRPASHATRRIHALATTPSRRRTEPSPTRPISSTATTSPTWSSSASAPKRHSTIFRLTYNSMTKPGLVATTIALGDSDTPAELPFGANATSPADQFLVVRGRHSTLIDAQDPEGLAKFKTKVSKRRRQITASIPSKIWNPRRKTVRMAAATGLWDKAAKSYLTPGTSATATAPGGAGGLADPTALVNVAFRYDEPLPDPTTPTVVTDPAWWRDAAQGHALAANDISSFFAEIDFGKLRDRVTDRMADQPGGTPVTGPINTNPLEPLLERPGSRLPQCRLRRHRRLPGPVPRKAPAVFDLRARRPAADQGPRTHAPPPLARRVLQPVPRNRQPGAVRRARRRRQHHPHPREPRPGQLVLRPRWSRGVRGMGRRCAPLQARPHPHCDRRLLDGWLRHVQVRDPVPGPLRRRPADRRPARSRRMGTRRGEPGRRFEHEPPCSRPFATCRS